MKIKRKYLGISLINVQNLYGETLKYSYKVCKSHKQMKKTQ